MKKIVALVFLFTTISLFAQNEYWGVKTTPSFQLGVYVTGKGCINTVDPPQGIKNDFQLSKMPDIGAKFSYKFEGTTNTKIFADISYLSAYMKYKLYNNSSINWTNEFHYINFGVGVELSSFLISLNLGIPTSGKWGVTQGLSYDIETKDLSTMLQLRVGAAIPIVESELGSLNFLIHADYFLVGALSQDSNYNPRIASLSLGLNYMFNL
ncbi:hypothetical protein D9V84_06280 [Bacteroidetes/Chlorobi group bacterium Naka2016]|jgi:hypothetical protein|nr:MAG: hypothetical protein D9V84_06280 [Bacteroidetes/Chlorobi group bacterium Naka2016]